MADTKLTGLTEQTILALDDWLYSVDKSDTTDDAAGSSRKFAYSTLLQYVPHGLTEISVTGATTATIGRMHVCSGTTADYTLTLPAASGNTGKIISVRMATGLTKLVTIDGNASETIDGSLTRVMWAGESAILLCDGSNWFKVGGRSLPMACSLARSADVSVTANADNKVAVNTLLIDNTGRMEDAANDRIQIARVGIHEVIAAVRYNVSGAITRLAGYANINSAATYSCMAESNSTGAGYPVCARPTLVDFAVNDWVELGAFPTSNTTVHGTGTTSGSTLTIREAFPW